MESILLVEDDPETARKLEKNLGQSGSFQIRRVESAEEALEETQGQSYDLLIVGWMLPKMNGPRLIEELREEGDNVPILMLTVRNSTKDLVRGLESGADDYMRKPFDFDKLEAQVKALLRRPPEWKPIDKLSIGPLTLNTARREAVLAGELLDLRKKEFDLLLLLADKTPDVVTRRALAERIWETEHVSNNSIDVTISGLRKKISGVLDEAGDVLQLETIRGVGYRLAMENGPADGEA